MKKFLLSALLLGAGISASAQSFELYLSNELENGVPTNYQLITEGTTFKSEMEIGDDYGYGCPVEFAAYVKATNKTQSPITLSVGYQLIKGENNIDKLEGAEFFDAITTCFGGACLAANPFPVEIAAGASTPGGWGEHLNATVNCASAEQAKELYFDCKANFTVTCGSEALHFTILYQTPNVAGVDGIEAADAPAEYFNLQGIKVSNPVAGEIYIKRQAGKTTKVVF